MSNTDHNIIGSVAPGFEPVFNAFADSFKNGDEAGAGFCILRDGEYLVDLVGGTRDQKKERPWETNTLIPVFSSTKAAASLVIAWLVDQNRLSYRQKVADLWPEFSAHGKGELTVAQVLSHQSGLSGITEPMESSDWFDWDNICRRLAAQEPIWEPGTASGYHPLTFGFLAGEIARRADAQGRTLGTILRQEFCDPEGIDFFIGTPATEHDRCADLHKPRALSNFGEINPATRAAFLEKWSSTGGRGTAAWRQAEFAAANGHGTAKSLARLMQLTLDGKIGDTRYLSEDTVYALTEPRISGPNLVLPYDLTFAAGLMVNRPNHFFGPNEATLGHSGWGGSCTFADPSEGLSGAYVMNKQTHALIGDSRPTKLIETLYACL